MISIQSTFKRGWELYSKHYNVFITLVLLVYVPIYAITGLSTPAHSIFQFGAKPLTALQHLLNLSTTLIVQLAAYTVIYYTYCTISDQHVSLSHAVKKTVGSWVQILKTMILKLIFLILQFMGVFVALLIPYTIVTVAFHLEPHRVAIAAILLAVTAYALPVTFAIRWIFSPEAVILRSLSGSAALKYSTTIMKNHFWLMVKFILCCMLMLVLLLATRELVGRIIGFGYLLNVLYSVAAGITSSFFGVAKVYLFLDIEQQSKAT